MPIPYLSIKHLKLSLCSLVPPISLLYKLMRTFLVITWNGWSYVCNCHLEAYVVEIYDTIYLNWREFYHEVMTKTVRHLELRIEMNHWSFNLDVWVKQRNSEANMSARNKFSRLNSFAEAEKVGLLQQNPKTHFTLSRWWFLHNITMSMLEPL